MTKKGHHTHHKSSFAHKAAATFGDMLIAGPIVFPALEGGLTMFNGATLQSALGTAGISAFNYDLNKGTFGSSGATTQILVRDVALVGAGLAFRKYVVRRIR